ncbi:uncharacterized protein NPIL_3191 [Nephila pilipes]|uniref:Uncharacterized protein n=1 Tax=Nephila pilipes TaxID=299642 RepID=A0A8X6UBQ7_NEPPI|nr:uncharacterized protein NPIL_3191 [Nephila pilipes]
MRYPRICSPVPSVPPPNCDSYWPSWPGFAALGLVEFEKVCSPKLSRTGNSQTKIVILLLVCGFFLEKIVSFCVSQTKNTESDLSSISEQWDSFCKFEHDRLSTIAISQLNFTDIEFPIPRQYEIIECYNSVNSNITACVLRNLTVRTEFNKYTSNRKIFASILEYSADALVLLQNYFPWAFQFLGGYIIAVGATIINQIIDIRNIGLKFLISCFIILFLKHMMFVE